MLPTSFIILLLLTVGVNGGDKYMNSLLENLLSDYNRNVRPVKNASDALKVKFGASLCRLIDVDEVNQVLTTSLWLEMQWRDRKLVWNPAEWSGIHEVHIPSDQIWIPDILLYNNADGEPHITVTSLARVDYNGTVLWQPPSIYKSLCPINIEYFPYDIQECFLKFGGWSNDGQTLDMEQIPVNVHDIPEQRMDDGGQEYLYLAEGMGLAFYHESAEWDLLSVTSSRYAQIYPGCCGQQYYIDIRYNIVLRRKAIFFTVMLTIPCMLIANLTPFVFAIPPNEHKMTFSISTFVAFSVFYLVLIELLPPTSLVLPLIGKYLLFTLFMIFSSILISVWTIQIYRKQAFVSEMKAWQRLVFIKTLPKYLYLKQLEQDDDDGSTTGQSQSRSASPLPGIRTDDRPPARNRIQSLIEMDESIRKFRRADLVDVFQRIAGNLKIIAANFNNQELESKITDEWRLMSLVIDRIFLTIYFILNLLANFYFIWNSRSLYDTRASLGRAAAFKPLSGDSLIITEGLNQI